MKDLFQEKLSKLWKSTGAWPEYQQAMRLALNLDTTDSEKGFSRLASLPGLCCQAAGGEFHWADDVALAWLLYYSAAHLMDSVQDGDEPDMWWASQGLGLALSAATGLFFSASACINLLFDRPETRDVARVIADDFAHSFLVMSSGQHADLTIKTRSLEEYWLQANGKSGAFFALACRSGARLADQRDEILDAYSEFGRCLGLLVQITDDLEDIHPSQSATIAGQRPQFASSLPAVYAFEVLPRDPARRLRELLDLAPMNAGAAQEAVSIVDASGAAQYIMIEMERQKTSAHSALKRAMPVSPAGDILAGWIGKM